MQTELAVKYIEFVFDSEGINYHIMTDRGEKGGGLNDGSIAFGGIFVDTNSSSKKVFVTISDNVNENVCLELYKSVNDNANKVNFKPLDKSKKTVTNGNCSFMLDGTVRLNVSPGKGNAIITLYNTKNGEEYFTNSKPSDSPHSSENSKENSEPIEMLNTQHDKTLEEKNNITEDLKQEYDKVLKALKEKDVIIDNLKLERDKAIEEKDAVIEDLKLEHNKAIEEKDAVIEDLKLEYDKAIEEKDAVIYDLNRKCDKAAAEIKQTIDGSKSLREAIELQDTLEKLYVEEALYLAKLDIEELERKIQEKKLSVDDSKAKIKGHGVRCSEDEKILIEKYVDYLKEERAYTTGKTIIEIVADIGKQQ